LVAGDAAAAFAVLLDEFAVDFDQRDAIKGRLLELFTLVGDSEQVVLEARRRLTSLMF
jgi:putative thioredoxin